MAAESAVRIIFLGDSASAVRSVSRLESSFGSLHRTAKLLAGGLAVAVVGGFAAATKAALDFQESMDKIKGLVGESQTAIDKYSKAILKMNDVPQGPKELADALFFITSAGIHGAKAIDVLHTSAKAAAAGLGDTKVVADAVTSAMNAYADANLSASDASDVLVATVREGKTAADALAPALGRVIAPAHAAGVKFYEVGAAIAAMTRVGLSADESVTALRGLLLEIEAPGKQAADAMKAIGTSGADMQKRIEKDGLLKALQFLAIHIHGNLAAGKELIPNVRALAGFLSAMGGNAKATAQIFADLKVATGSTDTAFKDAAEGGAFKMKVAIADIQRAAIPIGNLVIPLFARLAQVVAVGAVAIQNNLAGIERAVRGAVDAFVNGFRGFEPASRLAADSVHHNAGIVRVDVTQMGSHWHQVLAKMGRDLGQFVALVRTHFGEIQQTINQFVSTFRSEFAAFGSIVRAATAAFRPMAPVILGVVGITLRVLRLWYKEQAIIYEGIAKALVILLGAFRGAFHGIENTVSAGVTAIKTIVSWIKTLIAWINRIPHDIGIHFHVSGGGGIAGNVLRSLPGFGFIPRAEGGFVPGSTAGQPVPILAHAGEVVLNQAQQAAFGGAAVFKQMFGFRGEGPAFAAGGIVSPPKRRKSSKSPHSPKRGRVRTANARARSLLKAVDAVNQREDDADRAYGQLVRFDDISVEQFIRTDDAGNQYISQPDIDQRVAEIDGLITARNQMLALLDKEKAELKKAIAALRKAIAVMLQAIRQERKNIASLAKRLSQEQHKKKPNQGVVNSLQNQISAGGTRIGDLTSTIKDFRSAIGDEQLNLGHQLPFDRRDVELDILTLQQERKDVTGTTLAAGGSLGGGSGTGNIDSLLQLIGQLRLALGIQTAQQGILGSFQKGTLNVPETGLYALHAGESVTAPGVRRGGDGGSIGDVHVQVTFEGEAAMLEKFIKIKAVEATPLISDRIGRRATENFRSGRF